jgi:hypothetical protein
MGNQAHTGQDTINTYPAPLVKQAKLWHINGL